MNPPAPTPAPAPGTPEYRLRLWGRGSFVALLLVIGVARAVAVFTESVNWDEFALLQRAETLATTGVLYGGGRPGLVNVVLAPFAETCRNAVDALVQARHLWTLMVVAAAVAFALLLKAFLPESRTRWTAVATGVALWVLASHFLRFSVQVRTDQPAVLMALWGGVAILASRRRPWLAVVAGLCFAVGFLASQKLLYVGGIVAALAVGWHLVHGDLRWRREVLRVGLALGAMAAGVVLYRTLVGAMTVTDAGAVSVMPIEGQMSVFDYYRERLGFRYYRQMLPSLLAQVIAMLLLVIVTLDWAKTRGRHGAQLGVAWAVLAMGAFVIAFHAGRFPYFYIVLGLFPATIGALVLGPMLDRLEGLKQELAVLAVLWVPLVWFAVLQAAPMLADDQRHQRESINFVNANFAPTARGFQGHAAFACRHDPDPFKTRFFMNALFDFGGEGGEDEAERMAREFVERPVVFMIEPPANEPYPGLLRQLWDSRYVLYYRQVMVPGRRVEGAAGAVLEFDPIAAGEYRWWPDDGVAELVVGTDTVTAGGSVVLGAGPVAMGLPSGGAGIFAWAVDTPPAPDTTAFITRF